MRHRIDICRGFDDSELIDSIVFSVGKSRYSDYDIDA